MGAVEKMQELRLGDDYDVAIECWYSIEQRIRIVHPVFNILVHNIRLTRSRLFRRSGAADG